MKKIKGEGGGGGLGATKGRLTSALSSTTGRTAEVSSLSLDYQREK